MNDNEIKKFLEKMITEKGYSNIFVMGLTENEKEGHDFYHISRAGYPAIFRMAFEAYLHKHFNNVLEYAKELSQGDKDFDSWIDTLRREPVEKEIIGIENKNNKDGSFVRVYGNKTKVRRKIIKKIEVALNGE